MTYTPVPLPPLGVVATMNPSNKGNPLEGCPCDLNTAPLLGVLVFYEGLEAMAMCKFRFLAKVVSGEGRELIVFTGGHEDADWWHALEGALLAVKDASQDVVWPKVEGGRFVVTIEEVRP